MTHPDHTIPNGYKMTEVGVIPDDWEVKAIGDLFEFKNGLNKAKGYFGYGTPILNYTDVYHNRAISSSDIKGRVTVSNTELQAYQVRKGDVFFTRTSETVDEIGLSTVVLDEISNTVFSGFLLRARPKNNLISNDYKKYCFSSDVVRKSIRAGSSYTTRALTNGRLLSEVLIPLPPTLEEQRAIANALSEIDDQITALEESIAKKRELKQGAMQRLLTGEERLTGFSGVWEVKRLGEILTIRHGKSQKDVVDPNGEYPILATGGIIGWSKVPLYTKPSVLIGRKGTIDVPKYMNTPFWSVDTLFYSEIFTGNDPKFLYYRFELIDWYSYNEASGVPSLNARTIENIEIKVPLTLDEQQAIADVLSNMDAEISALEAERDKTITLKQGMMQELLTGKTRLI